MKSNAFISGKHTTRHCLATNFNKEIHMPCGTKKPTGGKKPPKK